MRIEHLHLRDFRNYREFDLAPTQNLTVLVGPNGAGKTNVIEAIQFVSTGRSFRNPKTTDLVLWGAPQAEVAITSSRDGRDHSSRGLLTTEGLCSWSLDGQQVRRSALAGKIAPVVLFVPDDLLLAKGPAEQRRSTLDALGEQLSATYGSLRRDYQKIVRQRNALLRDGCTALLLESLDEQLVDAGTRLYTHRRGLTGRLSGAMTDAYAALADGEALSITYDDRCGVGVGDPVVDIPIDDVRAKLTAELARRRSEELARRQTLVGPHRDDVTLSIDGRPARSFASQGQQRTVALAWKLAEVTIIEALLGTSPVLLLDDVMSELDESRRSALAAITRDDIQTLMTATDTTGLDDSLLDHAAVVTIGGESG